MPHPAEVIRPVSLQKVYVQIVEQIIELIKRGTFLPGTQLPAERDLARQLGVSRVSLREALTVLQIQGFVETKSGQGSFIADNLGSQISQPDPARLNIDESPFSLLQARKVLEPTIAALAASQCSDAARKNMEQILDWVDADHSAVRVLSDVFSEGDRKFHLAIAVAADNSILVSVQAWISRLMAQKLWLTLMRETSLGTPGRWQAAAAEHRLIYEAIKDRQPELARQHVVAHLETVERLMGEAELAPYPDKTSESS